MKGKSILVIFGTLVIGFVLGFIISAQITRSKINNMVQLGMEEGFKHRVYQLLDPTDEQIKKLDPIVSKYAEKNAEITKEFGEELKEQLESFDKEIMPFLDDAQKDRLKMMDKRRRELHGRGNMDGSFDHGFSRGKPGPPFMMFGPMMEDLNLSEEQIKKLEELRDSFDLKMNEIRDMQIDIDEKDAKIDSLFKNQRPMMMKVLTKEQMKVWEEKMKENAPPPNPNGRGRGFGRN